MNTDPVRFGARGNKYGAFNIKKTGLLKTMKLVHKSGSINCNQKSPASYWGCTYESSYGNNGLMTIITNAAREVILPSAKELKNNHCTKNHFYSLNGTTHISPELVFCNLPKKVSVSVNQELQIWFGQDWADCSEVGNTGTTCVNVYAWYD